MHRTYYGGCHSGVSGDDEFAGDGNEFDFALGFFAIHHHAEYVDTCQTANENI